MLHSIIFHILLFIFTAGLSWAFPARTKKGTSYLDEATLKRLYTRGSWFIVLGIFGWIPLCSWALGIILHLLAQFNYSLFGDTPHRIVPTLPWWCVVASCFAFAWSRYPLEAVIRFFGGQETLDATNIMSERMYDYDVDAAWRGLRIILVTVGFVGYVFASDYGVFIYDNRLVFNDLTSLFQRRTVTFQDLSSVEYAEGLLTNSGRITPEPIFIIQLKDGTEWKSNFNDLDKVAPVIDYLVERADMQIDTVPTWQ